MSAGVAALSNEELMRIAGQVEPDAPQGAAALSDEELRRLAGVSAPAAAPATFDERFGNTLMSSDRQRGADAEAMQARADEMLVGKGGGNAALAALYRAGNTAGLNLPRNAAAAIATGAGKIGIPGYPERSFSQNYQLSKDQEEALARQHPYAAGAGTAAGIVGGAVALPAFEAAQGANLAARAGMSALTGAAYSGLGELADTKDAAKAGGAALLGGALGGVATPAMEKLGRVIGSWRSAKVPYLDDAGQFTDEARGALEKAGINLADVPQDIIEAFKAKGPGDDVIREAMAKRQGISLTRGQAEQDFARQQREYAIAQSGKAFGEDASGSMREFFDRQGQQVRDAAEGTGTRLAGGTDRVAVPQDAADAIAARGRDISTSFDAQMQEATQRADDALARLRGRNPIDALDAANTGRTAIRDAGQTARQSATNAYTQAFEHEGTLAPEFFHGMAADAPGQVTAAGAPNNRFAAPLVNRIADDLASRAEPIIINEGLTPRASAMLTDLGRVTQMRLGRNGQPLEGQDVAGVNLRGLDQARKIITQHLYGGAGTTTPTDRRAMRGIIDAFDNEIEHGVNSALFDGDPAALDALRNARQQFASFKRTFGPTQQGDRAGNALRQIVERDASPEQVATYLYGSTGIDRSGRGAELATRLRGILGHDSNEYRAIQQGYLSRVLGDGTLTHEAMDQRIRGALSGEGRRLAYSLLTPQQINGLQAFQQASQRARAIREGVPDWVGQLARGEFNPNIVASNLWGKATVGGNATSASYANAIRRTFGETSPEWQGVRQAVWQKLTSQAGVQKQSTSIEGFLTKEGRALANTLFTAEERNAMRAYGNTMRDLIPARQNGVSASPNSATAPTIMAANAERLKRHGNKIAMLLGAAAWGSGHGYLAAAGAASAGKGISSIGQALLERGYKREVADAIGGAAIKMRPGKSTPPIDPRLLAKGAGVAAPQALSWAGY